MTASATITTLLGKLRSGDSEAIRQIFPIVYDELRTAAGVQRRRLPASETLNTTALVHETFLKLVANRNLTFEDRTHFMAVAATAMRHILIGYARRRSASKRGGGAVMVPLVEVPDDLAGESLLDDGRVDALLALDQALTQLQQRSDRQSRIVECRFFGGMSIEETATALGVSPATVKRDWSLAQAWLYREIQGGAS